MNVMNVVKLVIPCVLLLVFLSACQSTSGFYLGALADADSIRELALVLDTPQRWEDLYLTVDSLLTRQGSDYQVSGHFAFSQHPQIMYSRAAHLTLTLFLVNKENRVVDYRTVSRFSMLSTEDTIPFSVTVPVAEGGVAYTFGYEVTFIESEEGGSPVKWNLPRTGR